MVGSWFEVIIVGTNCFVTPHVAQPKTPVAKTATSPVNKQIQIAFNLQALCSYESPKKAGNSKIALCNLEIA